MKLRTLALVLALAAPACPQPPQPPTPPPAPSIYTLGVGVYVGDPAQDEKLPGVGVSLQTVANPSGPEGVTDGAGNVTFRLPAGDYDIWAAPEGYLRAEQHVELRGDQTIVLVLAPRPPPVVVLPRLVRDGQHFALDTNQPFTAIEASDFNLLNRWQHGEDIEPVLVQRAGAGFNMLRVWTLYNLPKANIGVFLDIDYSRIPAFLQACARHGLYVEFTAYTSTFDDGTHWRRLEESVHGISNALLCLVNENDQPANTIDTSKYARPTANLASHGSNGSQSWPVEPYWDYATFHTNGAPEEQRKVGHNAWEIWAGPTLTNETSRYPEVGMWADQLLERQKQLAHDSAAGGALLAGGSCFHSVLGKTSQLWDADTLAVARAWAAGARSVPLMCQHGAYRHRDDLETGDLLRVYQRGNDPACIVKIWK